MPRFEVRIKRSRQLVFVAEGRDADHAMMQFAWKSGFNSFADMAAAAERTIEQARNDFAVAELSRVASPKAERIKKLPMPPRRIAA